MNVMRLKSAAVAAVVGAVCLMSAPSHAALIVAETTDFSNVAGSFGTFVGSLMDGTNTISGSLAADCAFDPAVGIGCNLPAGGDGQDSILVDLPSTLEITSAALTLSNVTAPFGMSGALLSAYIGGSNTPFNFLVEASTIPLPLPVPGPGGSTANLALTIIGAGAFEPGDYAFDWQIALTTERITTAPLSTPATLSLLGLGVLGVGIAHRRRQRRYLN